MASNSVDIITGISNLSVVDPGNDKILGFSNAGNKVGWLPVSFVTNQGYAARRWNMNNSSPVGEAVGNIDYLRDFPSMIGLGCYLVDRNHGRRKLDPTNHYKFATGETAALDGSMGDYMWGWNTPWYYSWWVDGNYYYEAVSLKPIPGKMNYRIPVASTSALGVSVVDRTNLELVSVINNTARYRGGNNDSTKDSNTTTTQLGRAATQLNAQTFGEYARKKGDGWEALWYTHWATIGILYRIIMGTRNCQTAVNANKDANGLYQGGTGTGVTDVNDTWWNETTGLGRYPFLSTDVAVDMADGVGEKSVTFTPSAGGAKTVKVPVFFGLKNFYGYLGRWLRGMLVNKIASGAGDVYVLPNMYSTYSMGSLSGLSKVAQVPKVETGNQYDYPKQRSMQNLCGAPTVLGGTSSTYFCDGFNNDNAVSGLRVPYVGGFATNGGNAGLGCLNVNDGVTTADARCGSPLCESEEDWSSEPFLAV